MDEKYEAELQSLMAQYLASVLHISDYTRILRWAARENVRLAGNLCNILSFDPPLIQRLGN